MGTRYLVWAVSDDEGNYVVSDCNPTDALEKVAPLVSELRELQAGGGATYIFGGVYRNRPFPNGVTEDELANYSSVPLPHISVLVSSGDARYAANTDEHGLFVVPLPGGGRYRIDTDLPWSLARRKPSSEVDLGDHECMDMSVWTQYDFSFSGRVVDADGNPLEGVPVELLPENDLRSVAHSFTSSEGEYTLSASEPGKYLIALNWDGSPSRLAPFPTTLYPGVHDEKMAAIVQTSETGRAELADFHLSKPIACKAQFRVEERSGGAAKNEKILVKYFSAQFWHEPDLTLPLNLFLTEDAPVHVVASRSLSNQEELRSDEMEIRSCPKEPIVLRLRNKMKID